MASKIALDFRMQAHTGFYNYASELYDNLSSQNSEETILKFSDPKIMRTLPHSTLAFARNLYELTLMSRKLKTLDVDIFHCTKNYGVPISRKIPIVTTLHDIIPLALSQDYAQSALMRTYYRYNLTKTIEYSKKIITISKFSRDEIIKYFPEAKNKIEVIYLANCLIYKDIEQEKINEVLNKYQITQPYILTMGGAEPRKNIKMLCKLFIENDLESDLVIIGNNWRGISLDEYKKYKNIKILTKLEQSELACLYKQADFFVFPSIYEGFGLPVLEAMSQACPVLAHNASSLPEICEQAAYLVDMRKPLEVLKSIKYLQNNHNLQKELKERGLNQAQKFSWSKTSQKTYKLYQEILSEA